jgi:hypothetical protein
VNESVVLVPFPDVAEFVEPWMERTCTNSKPSRGIPAHVTLLYPSPGDVVTHLPVHARAHHAVMLTEVEPERWELQATFAFA